MLQQIFDGKKQERRIDSMLKNFSRIKYILLLVLFLAVPVKSWAGAFGILNTDGTSFQLFTPWDLRARNTFVQVTNTGALPITVHVQVFNAAAGCPEIDFYDTYTANDTHVYDLRGLTRNNGIALNAALPDGGFGIVVVTNVAGVDGPALGGSFGDFVLTGNYRIIDAAGYEYRSNADSFINAITFVNPNATFNFNSVDGANASDVIGIVIADAGTGFIEVNAAPGISATFDVDQIDAAEQPLSCEDFTFSCSASNFNVGINDVLPNSRIGNRLCPGFSEPTGVIIFTLEDTDGDPNYITGFVGLNNGDGTGSMDTWFSPLTQGTPNLSGLIN